MIKKIAKFYRECFKYHCGADLHTELQHSTVSLPFTAQYWIGIFFNTTKTTSQELRAYYRAQTLEEVDILRRLKIRY